MTHLVPISNSLIFPYYFIIMPKSKRFIYQFYISMFKLFIATLLVMGLASTTDIQTDLQLPPKLPLFIGKGYDILLGNPFSSGGVDPGFRHQIFEFTYAKNETTEDGKFIIPDGMAHRKTTACSFSTQIYQYRGTQSYQGELKTKAQIGGGYNGILFKASFSQSTTYEKVHNQTINQNMSLTHATAECQCYEMSLDLFKPRPISANFWEGVRVSFNAKNWDKFIEQFGTHYVYEVIMGGRAIQEIQYSSKSVSQLQTMTIDINIAAKASFAKYYADASFDFHKYETQIKYAETLSENIHELYIGGQPPRTGKILDWQQTIIKEPQPITYKMMPLSDLFQFDPNKTIDLNAAKTQFLQALDHYCAQRGCKEPGPDKPKPQPASVTTMKTQTFGGGGGSPFEWSHINPIFNARKIHLRSGSQVDNIQIEISDGVTTYLSPQFGGQGGSDRDSWAVPSGEHITQVEFRSGDRVDSLTFVTNKGNRSPRYGGNGGSYHLLTFGEDYRIVGLFGRDGSRLDQLGFILGKTVFHNGAPMTVTKHLVLNDS